MWALNAAVAAPDRVTSVVAFGMPAVALPGLQRDVFFRLMTTPGLGRLVSRAPAPKSADTARKAMRQALGAHAAEQLPDVFFDAVRLAMARPGYATAMWTHLNLAMRSGRP